MEQRGMKCVSYNIQYGIGLDGRYDIARIVDAVRGADVIALQEVSRNNPENQGRDMVAEIAALLPEYFHVFSAPYGVDMGSAVEKGRAVTRLFEFGNMILSRTPILTTRNLLLPRRRTWDILNLQRAALEAMIATAHGPVRFYSVHLDQSSPRERLDQIRWLIDKVTRYGIEGGAVTGTSERGFPEPPHPDAYVLMGDFNCEPGSAEYLEIVGTPDSTFGFTGRGGLPLDAAPLDPLVIARQHTWVDPQHPDDAARAKTLDYCFVHASLKAAVRGLRVDETAVGSDHRPVWLELA